MTVAFGGAADPVATGSQDEALLALLRLLAERGYAFVTPTPLTHARVVARTDRQRARSVRDVLGWSLPFRRGEIDAEVEALLDRAGMLHAEGAMLRSRVRVSSLHGRLFLHSAYPTNDTDAVFFGPDSYRFADLIRSELSDGESLRMLDIGTGSGVGAIVAALARPNAPVSATDINPRALRFARINAAAAGVTIDAYHAPTLDPLDGVFDVVTANPPYIIDADSRLYRDGGGMHGAQISFDMTRMALDRLAPGGRMILYTGSAIVAGGDALKQALADDVSPRGYGLAYRELDPDVFGEELDQPGYADVERIALVAALITRPA
ncbi:class I SAM-dependent methyltransferase [Sphingomonas populi]|uniref:Class I SAM-dependent methyltransferase n=1 Tax=Sphingomonas populi TaxID=2484750 RepID=A0A4Q6XWA6_9SPHN|nr:class I SAM-dependent methyltransferase [Sphingomonas populi]RZF64650.1 class I SAM-dependent methyltransferase [Sphingomonas populi]